LLSAIITKHIRYPLNPFVIFEDILILLTTTKSNTNFETFLKLISKLLIFLFITSYDGYYALVYIVPMGYYLLLSLSLPALPAFTELLSL
jgi:hypothetical protein